MSKEAWIDTTVEIIRLVAAELRVLTTDDIWPYIEYPPDEPRWMGDAITKAKLNGWIEKTERTIKSERKQCNSRDVRVWKSLIYGLLPAA